MGHLLSSAIKMQKSILPPIIIVAYYNSGFGVTTLYKNGTLFTTVPANTGENTYSGYIPGNTVKVSTGGGLYFNTIDYYLNDVLINTYSNYSGLTVETPNITVSNGNIYTFITVSDGTP